MPQSESSSSFESTVSSTGRPGGKLIRPYRVGPSGPAVTGQAAKGQVAKVRGTASHSPTVSQTSVSGETMRRVDRSDRRNGRETIPGAETDRVETAIRLISETAHDLRSPLASVSAAIEMVKDGDFGAVSTPQSECLTAALRQCDYLSALVGEMLHADGLLNGMTTLHRRAVHRAQIQQMVTEATVAVLATKRIHLLFDGINEQSPRVYVDAAVVCRLLVNLVVNAERASGEDSHILIRVKDDADLGVARWSVVDCGSGMSNEQIAGLQSGEHLEGTQGTGLGLMICRQLATLHFSGLTIRSREGSGTDVTFETPIAGVNALATAYARFRAGILTGTSHELSPATGSQKHSATLRSNWSEASLGFTGAGPQRVARVAIGTLSLVGEATIEEADALDQLLQSRLGRFELSFQTTRREWVWVFDADHRSVQDRMVQLTRVAEAQLPQLKLTWGEPSVAPVDQRGLQRLLIDRMTKQTLAAAVVAGGGPIDQDSVRLGTEPIAATKVATSRLDEELRRLSTRLRGQSKQMQNQAKSLRPPI